MYQFKLILLCLMAVVAIVASQYQNQGIENSPYELALNGGII